MIVLLYLLFLSFFAFFIPKNYRALFLIILALLVPVLYFWFVPPHDYDIHRYHLMMNTLRNLDFVDIFNGNAIDKSIYINLYIENSAPLSLLYFWCIAKLFPNVFLAYITGVVVYGIIFLMIHIEFKRRNIEYWKLGIIILFYLMSIEYRSITGVRNEVAFSIMAFVLYKELNKEISPYIAFVIYVALIFMHQACGIILIVRCFFIFSNKLSQKLIIILCLLSNLFIGIFERVLEQFSYLNVVTFIINKIQSYSESKLYNYRMVAGTLIMVLFITFFYLFLKRINCISDMQKYNSFFECILATTYGTILYDVTFNRMEMLLLLLFIPYFCVFLEKVMSDAPLKFIAITKPYNTVIEVSIIGFSTYIIIFFEAWYHVVYFYNYLAQCIHIL